MTSCKLEVEDNVQKDKLAVDEITSSSTTNSEAIIDNSEEVHAVTINSTSGTEAWNINTEDSINNHSINDNGLLTNGATLSTDDLKISSNETENIISTTQKIIVETSIVTEFYNDSQTETSGIN